MNKQKFQIEGIEMLQKDVVHYEKQSSRIYLPLKWKKVIVVRVE